jgi:hypothetical protein
MQAPVGSKDPLTPAPFEIFLPLGQKCKSKDFKSQRAKEANIK